MKKLVALSSKEVLFIQASLSDYLCKLNYDLSVNDDPLILEEILDSLDICDSLRRKLSKVFPDLSIVD